MAKKLFVIMTVFFISYQAQARVGEILTINDMVQCMTFHIMNRIVGPDTVMWDHIPAYERAGSHFEASWHTDMGRTDGSLYMSAGPKDKVHCDYQAKPDGSPDWSKPGVCVANFKAGDAMFDYEGHDLSGNWNLTQVRVAYIQNSLIYCAY